LGVMTQVLGMPIPFACWMPRGLIPIALADERMPFAIPGKDGLTVLNDRPLNAETPPHLLNDLVTPTSRLFIRNNGLVADIARKGDASGWTLASEGEVEKKLELSLRDLKCNFKNYSYLL